MNDDRRVVFVSVAILAMIGVAQGIAVFRASVVLIALNAIAAVVLLIYGAMRLNIEFRTAPANIWALVRIYAVASLAWGSLYYLVFLVAPSSFLFDVDVKNMAIARMVAARQRQFEEAVDLLQLADATMLLVNENGQVASEQLLHDGLSLTLEGSEWIVKYDVYVKSRDSVPDFQIEFVPKNGFRKDVRIPSPVQSPDSEVRKQQLVNSLKFVRASLLADIRHSSTAPEVRSQFNLIDFVYFAFMLPGADVVKPAVSWVRVLVLLEIMTFLAFGFRQLQSPVGLNHPLQSTGPASSIGESERD